MAQELNPEEFHKLYFYNSILHHSQQYIAYGWLNKMWTAEVLFNLDQGFSNFWCYGAHEEIDHNLRSPTINF